MEHGPTTTNSRGSRRSNIARTVSRDFSTVPAAESVSGMRRLTSSGVASKSLETTLTFCNWSWDLVTMRGLHGGSNGPQFRKEFELQGLGQIGHSGCPAGAALVSDDPFHRLDVGEPPELKLIVKVDQPLRQPVQIPILDRVVIDAEPSRRDLLAGLVGLREIAIDGLRRHVEPTAAQQSQHLIVQAGSAQRALQCFVINGV